jgi:hypothetical protein
MALSTKRLLVAMLVVDVAGGVVAVRHRVAGEPFGIGGSLDVRQPAVLALWGSGLSAPIASLVLAVVMYRHRPRALRAMGALFAFGALSEPVFWGLRPCPRHGRMLLLAHVAIASALAIGSDPSGRAGDGTYSTLRRAC